MLEEPRNERYSLHDLLRVFAGELLELSGERTEAESRLVEHYLHSARSACLLYGRPPIAELTMPDPTVAPEAIADVPAAVAWYQRERAVVAAVIDLAFSAGEYRSAAILLMDVRPMSEIVDSRTYMLARTRRAIDVVDDIGEPAVHAELEREMGNRQLIDPPVAQQHFQRALDLYRQIGDAAGEANTYRNLANLFDQLNDSEAAYRYGELSVSAARRSGRRDILGLSLTTTAVDLYGLGRFAEAIALSSEALENLRAEGIIYFQPVALNVQARGLFALGDPTKALAAAEEGLSEHFALMADPELTSELWATVARAALECCDLERAGEACDQFDRARDELTAIDDGRYERSRDHQRVLAAVDMVRIALTQASS